MSSFIANTDIYITMYMCTIDSIKDIRVRLNVRCPGVSYTSVIFIALMFVKVQQQCWLVNKSRRGITVTRYA